MAKVLKILNTLRNHWKKSTFASLALAYGVNYGKEKYELVGFVVLGYVYFIITRELLKK